METLTEEDIGSELVIQVKLSFLLLGRMMRLWSMFPTSQPIQVRSEQMKLDLKGHYLQKQAIQQ